MSERPDPSGAELSRRGLFGNVVNGIAVAIVAALAVPLGGFFVLPAFKRSKAVWKEVGPLDDFVAGEIKLVPLKPLQNREWPADWGTEAAWVYRRGERDFVVYDLHCTHVGCPVNWSPQAKRFFSPCHGGVFDVDGRVLSGPPPRPLDRYETKIEKGVLYAGAIYQLNRRLERLVS